MTLDDIWSAITAEQVRARQLHGDYSVGGACADDPMRHLILSEEVGEVATEVQTGDREALVEELVQVAAVAVAWLRVL